MKVCAFCGDGIDIDRYFSRKSTCPKCGGDLHVCLNCTFYSESAHNKCLEPKAEFQRIRDRANFCDYFRFRDRDISSPSEKEKEDARSRFDELFRK